jgi:hypothetical protein
LDARDRAKAERAEAEEAVRDQRRTDADRENAEKELRAYRARVRAEGDRDRVWRFIEFRGLDVPSLRAVLTDPAAIAAYEQNPFNPHAIARLRLSAYQKCIVMNYIDALIEWGDVLFTEFQMETVNEATLLYVQALEILGARPVEVGECGEGNESERTYDAIARTLGNGSQFLVEMETYTHVGTGAGRSRSSSRPQHQYVIDAEVANYYRKEALSSYRRCAAAATHRATDKEGHDTSEARASKPRQKYATRPRRRLSAAPLILSVGRVITEPPATHHVERQRRDLDESKRELALADRRRNSRRQSPGISVPLFASYPTRTCWPIGIWLRTASTRSGMAWISPARCAGLPCLRRRSTQ